MAKIGFNNSNNECIIQTVEGIREIYLSRRSSWGSWRYEETSTLQTGKIVDNTFYGEVYAYDIQPTASFRERMQVTPERSYTQEFNFTASPTEVFQRDKIEQIKVLRDMMVFYVDNNNRIWLAGESNGMRVRDYNMSTDNNSYDISLGCRERSMIREVDSTFFKQFITPKPLDLCLCDSGQTWTNLCQASWNSLCSTCWS